MALDIYLEIGNKRTFAGALEWPGWCRSAKEEGAAIGALQSYADRYAEAVGAPGALASDGFTVVERLEGDATTDFGAPGQVPAYDARPIDQDELTRLTAILRASWQALDKSAAAAEGAELRKGPRGGGRELDAIRAHVFEADRAYLRKIGGRYPTDGDMGGLRDTIVETLAARVRGEPEPPSRRPTPPWPPGYLIRRSAWHALDHAWEIEDRSI